MYKISSILLFACFLTTESLYTLPVKPENGPDVASRAEGNKISYRLPNFAIPKSYSLDITVYLDEHESKNFTFIGEVAITFNLQKNANNITLHSEQLNIQSLKLKLVAASELEVSHKINETTNFLIVTKNDQQDFVQGDYVLTIKYEGKLNDDLRGFYRSHYTDDKGTKVWLATTHFEPVGARRAFPCFDEPEYKATFDMAIKHRKDFTAIFNMEKTKNSPFPIDHDMFLTRFKTTPPMSTYLLAFVVSNFETETNSAKNFTVHARPNAKKFGKLAVKEGEQILKKLEEFTNVPFEIGKMDQIAIPQFTAGAMENWGLVTYREPSLLYDEENSTTAEKQNIVQTIAHEFAHQWFGNLVSPKWWKYLWLNEGFATFFQSYITEQVETTWRSVEQSVVESIQTTAFNTDSSNDTHPINHDVESPKEISAIFDSISYQKGGAVIRMMQHYLTDEIFKKGLQQYLKDFTHKAATSDDLFKSIEKVLKAEKKNIEITKMMDNWVNKAGYPLVTVIRDYDKKSITLKQERFFTYNASDEERKDNVWQIPINFATKKNPDFKNTSASMLFIENNDTIDVDVEKEGWIILNKQQTGFYRVNYDEKNWKLISDYLKSPKRDTIHPLNRAQLINDAFALVKEDILGLKTLLSLTAYLKNETDYIAWYPAYETFSYLNSKLVNTGFYPLFKEFALNVTDALVKDVTFEEVSDKDDHLKKLNRIRAINLACSLGHKDCRTKMQKKLEAWLKDEENNVISKDLRSVTLCQGLRNANRDLWDQVFNKSKSHPDYNQKSAIIGALGCVNEKTILEWYLNHSLTNETRQYLQSAIIRVLGNVEVGVDVVLDFIQPNIFKLHWKLDHKKALINIINIVGQKITTEEQLKKLKAMNSSNILIPNDLIDEAVRLAESNLKWLQKHNETLTDQFVPKQKNGVGTITSSVGLIASLLVLIISKNNL